MNFTMMTTTPWQRGCHRHLCAVLFFALHMHIIYFCWRFVLITSIVSNMQKLVFFCFLARDVYVRLLFLIYIVHFDKLFAWRFINARAKKLENVIFKLYSFLSHLLLMNRKSSVSSLNEASNANNCNSNEKIKLNRLAELSSYGMKSAHNSLVHCCCCCFFRLNSKYAKYSNV